MGWALPTSTKTDPKPNEAVNLQPFLAHQRGIALVMVLVVVLGHGDHGSPFQLFDEDRDATGIEHHT